MEAPQILTQIFNQRKALMTQSITKPSKLYIGKNLFTKLRERILGEEKDGLDIELSRKILDLVIDIDETNLDRLEVNSDQVGGFNCVPSTLMKAPKSLKDKQQEESIAKFYRTIESEVSTLSKYSFDEDVWTEYFNNVEEDLTALRKTNETDIWSSANSDAETITYDNGASESKTELRFDLIPPDEIATIAKVLGQGAIKYGEDNWKALPTWTHLNHALQHIFAYLANDKSDDHLSHAATRLIFAMWSNKKEK